MPRQARAVATRHAVLLAAAAVFEREGYAASGISDILAEGGVTRGALYFHFGSKEELAQAIIAEQQAWLDHLQPRAHSPLQVAVDTSYGFIQELADSVLMRASVRLTIEQGTFLPAGAPAYHAWADRAEEVFEQARSMGHLQPGWKPRELALMCTSCITGLQLSSTALSARSDMTRRLHVFWKAVLPGIATPEQVEAVRITPPRRRATRRPPVA
ncbi:ScbR family autoregulator-binding transcription factor [Leekyejoonella antrihumi]|uniref:TetR family transcriptional regulator n=1 Tax=Leekyejoonella antrihumi TaxID=1660198 RepID=A0A563DSC9_9MICO|nr:ScbR family autoregulator-binding transcription factor [Leekyejoonella antrihumi]TWP32842.1 TetR family transcriptional regulator [Leekyejoonella antrihumi]